MAIVKGIKLEEVTEEHRKEFRDLRFDSNEGSGQIEMVTFHQNYSYEDFVEGIRPSLAEEGGLDYELRPGVFRKIVKAALDNPHCRFVLIIDEINRGNIPKILGDLITLIESSRRLGQNNETKVTLPYSGDSFGVPENVFIIGTMNTADRSILPLDIALRRRFDHVEMMPNPDHDLISEDVDGINLRKMLKAINARISLLLDRERQIGHTYLFNVETVESLANIFKTAILPLLLEYFYDDWSKVQKVLGGAEFIKKSSNKEFLDHLKKDDITDSDIYERIPWNAEEWLDPNQYKRIYKKPESQVTVSCKTRIQTPPKSRIERMSSAYTVLEHKEFPKLNKRDLDDLEDFHHRHSVFGFGTNGRLRAENYVGVVTTRLGTVIEILPKIELGDTESPGHEQTREAFLGMLRAYGGLNNAKNLPPSAIRTLRHFPVLEIFIRLFLVNLNLLIRGGLGRQYRAVQENLPFLRGRIVFQGHLRENLVDRSRFFVEHDELNPNRPANRLIRTTLDRLKPIVRNERNRQLLADLAPAFSMIPASQDLHTDWRIHSIDRYMQHYKQAMQWVELFLFNRGPATYFGKHINQSLLFPMEQVFEHFVTHCFRRYQDRFKVAAQGPGKRFMVHGHNMKPDISLCTSSDSVRFILDAKWKHISGNGTKPIDEVSSNDLYQLYAYGKRYDCQTVALVYPRNKHFTLPCTFRFFDNLKLVLVPSDVSSSKASECSVQNALRELDT